MHLVARAFPNPSDCSVYAECPKGIQADLKFSPNMLNADARKHEATLTRYCCAGCAG